MNKNENKLKLKDGKQIVYIDETNFKFFTRKTQGRSGIGSRAVQVFPAICEPNIHEIGAIYSNGFVRFERKRGSLNAATAVDWNSLNDLVIVRDNAPAHTSLRMAFKRIPAQLLRLGQY